MPYYKYHKHKALAILCAFMPFLITVLSLCFITNITNIGALTTVCVNVLNQYTLLTECLITNITNIRALNTVCAIMSYQIALLYLKPYYTLNIYMDVHPMYI